MKGKLPHIRQNSYNDCGIACLNSLLKFYGYNYQTDYLRDFLVQKDRYSLQDLIFVLNKLGIKKAKAFKINKVKFENVLSELNRPVIALIEQEERNHFVVVYNSKKKYLIISDPMKESIIKQRISSFNESFSGVILTIDSEYTNLNLLRKEKAQTKKSIFFDMIIGNKWKVLSVIFLSLLVVISTIIGSLYLKFIIDAVVPMNLDGVLSFITLIFLAIGMFRVTAEYLRNHIIIRLNLKVENKLVSLFFLKILRLPILFFKNRENGEVFSRYIDGLNIKEAIGNNLIGAIVDLFILVAISSTLFFINMSIFLIILVTYLLIIGLIFVSSELIDKRNNESIISNSKAFSFLVEQFGNMQINIALGLTEKTKEKFETVYNKKLESGYRESIVFNNANFVKNLFSNIFFISIIWVSTKQIFNDNISLGSLVMISTLSSFLLPSLDRLISSYLIIRKSLISLQRYSDIINYPEENYGQERLELFNFLTINEFSYELNSKDYLFEDINLSFKKGDKLLIIGDSGSGKSTFAQCFVRFRDIKDSSIYINGLDINKYDLNSLREKIIYIDESPYLFKGTLMENLQVRENIDMSLVISICKMCKIYETIKKLPGGFNYYINENATNLSTGQKQKIALARALLKEPDVLILDEALCNVDYNSLQVIEEFLIKSTLGIIFITHNYQHLMDLDKVYIFKEKKLMPLKNEETEKTRGVLA
ncbi:peptidase domain-containing ABC transporter [Paenibacillus polymyxa]|uniref:peptidase domain-containing ABC transporter n=2 Tax=Paenibacillus polymyxa TaxID=1406 RepID=UPI001FB4E530|nr:peptidase domain-containing ABC transporter [Paenibacillus polymyxa]MCJ1219906.1 peptidase domain-containing ABC transporter [Paenibacillus polymyxa]